MEAPVSCVKLAVSSLIDVPDLKEQVILEIIPKKSERQTNWNNVQLDFSASDSVRRVLADINCFTSNGDRFDVIFVHCMPDDANEASEFLKNSLSVLRSGGRLCFIESCEIDASVPADSTDLSAQYGGAYTTLLHSVTIPKEGGLTSDGWKITAITDISEDMDNKCTLLWHVEKTESTDQVRTRQIFLDNDYYLRYLIPFYELETAEDFNSSGGSKSLQDLVDLMSLKPGQAVLDVGCGLGGSAFIITEHHDVSVTGLDVSVNMLAVATLKAHKRRCRKQVKFLLGDIMACPLKAETFDVIFSKDVFIFIKDKQRLFAVLLELLKPGGKLVFSDYGQSLTGWTDSFIEFKSSWSYNLITAEEYVQQIRQAGFVHVSYIKKETLYEYTQEELKRSLDLREVIDETKKAMYDVNISWYRGVLEHVVSGNFTWNVFSAQKAESI